MNKASERDGIPVELFQILKYDTYYESAALNMPANLENSAVATGLEKVSFIPIQKKAMPKNVQATTELHSSHTLVMFKILQVRLQQYVNQDLPDVQAGFGKGRGTRGKNLPTSVGSLKNQESSRKKHLLLFY